jgi:hypothetical protein
MEKSWTNLPAENRRSETPDDLSIPDFLRRPTKGQRAETGQESPPPSN